MTNFAKDYLAAIDRLTGRPEFGNATIESSRPELPPVFVSFYRDWPVNGVLSAFTMGVSVGAHVEALGAHPELVISLRTTDRTWGAGLGFASERARHQALLGIGSTLDLREPITSESAMSGFVLTQPHHRGGEEIRFRFEDREVVILEAHPVLPSELLIARQNRAEFSARLSGARYAVNRIPVMVDTGPVDQGTAGETVSRRIFKCRVCSFEGSDSAYCPECLADTMKPAYSK